ncbi:MAG TPA: ABC transporter ATP-binding protein [Stellaceae bacterium]|nr:ABC transporter ATP-binding protein [Stellaceae bacterium]
MELSARGIGHSYGALEVLESVDLAVSDGEIVALIGPSGCGKSTLLGILGGLIAPERGEVTLAGTPPSDCLNPLTFVFQDFALLPWRTVAGNVALPLEHHPLAAAERRERVDAALDRLGLAEFRDAYPKQLSGGMRQRVGIARALVVRPAVLLMDEPLSALDAQTRELLMEDFLALWLDQRVASVYVTHNLAEALRVADLIVVLSRRPGRVKATIPVAMPQRERQSAAAERELARLGQSLWELLRDDAVEADREVANG